jgi:hypothetical protein
LTVDKKADSDAVLREYGQVLKIFAESKEGLNTFSTGILNHEDKCSSGEVNYHVWLKRVWELVSVYGNGLTKEMDPAVLFYRQDEPGE